MKIEKEHKKKIKIIKKGSGNTFLKISKFSHLLPEQ